MLKNKKTIKWIITGVVAAVSYVIAKKTAKEIEQVKVKIFDNISVDCGEEDN